MTRYIVTFEDDDDADEFLGVLTNAEEDGTLVYPFNVEKVEVD